MSFVSTHIAAICGVASALSVAVLTVGVPAAAQVSKTGSSKLLWVYVGLDTLSGSTKGIFIYSMNPSNGLLTPEGVGPDVESPSYLTLSPNHRFSVRCK